MRWTWSPDLQPISEKAQCYACSWVEKRSYMAKRKRLPTAARVEPNYGQRFDGSDYVPALDDERLTTQLALVYRATCDHEWHTIEEIKQITGIVYDASVSKHLRHLRYKRFGNYLVEKRRVTLNGLWEYRVGEKDSGPNK